MQRSKAPGAERPSAAEYGSDVIVEVLKELGIPFVALNPGASFRGLHDSLVNFQGGGPEMLLCPHEEIAVAIAHGYARATGKPMACALHDVVGLQHGTMAIFNAWCDRTPIIVLGGTGPMDSSLRRPYIDWVHTALVQGNQVRDYVKWDDQPGSVAAIPESVLRGYRIATTEPQGPVYLCFDVETQEEKISQPMDLPNVARFAPPASPTADPSLLYEAARLLVRAEWPVIVADNVGRHPGAIKALVELAELLGAGVVDGGRRFNFPSTHPLDVTLSREEALADADVLLGLDVVDLGGASSGVKDRSMLDSPLYAPLTVIHISLSDLLQHSWATDVQRLHPVDIPIAADTAEALPQLVELCRKELAGDSTRQQRIEARRQRVEAMNKQGREKVQQQIRSAWDLKPISAARLYGELWELIKGRTWSLLSASGRLPVRSIWDFTEAQQFLAGGGGGGLGYATGSSLGAALAFKGTGRTCVSVVGDGEFMMTPNALWTASHHELPLLMVIFNNRSYYNDEGHQEYIAVQRNRPVENKGVGIHITDPDSDYAALARSFSVAGFGPVDDPAQLRGVLAEALKVVDSGEPALVDVRTQPR